MYTRLFLQSHPMPALTQEEAAMLEAATGRTTTYAARQIITRPLAPLNQCMLLLDGFVERYLDTRDGKRQLVGIHVPGDFVDLHSFPLHYLDHFVAAITGVTVALFPHAAVRDLTRRSATIAELLWKSTLVDAAMNREWIVSVGARSAAVRLAHLFCELYVRLERVGMATSPVFDLPVTQIDLADATGLTPVHTNRMLRELRERGLVEFKSGVVTIRDWTALQAFGEFDPSYLYLDPPTGH